MYTFKETVIGSHIDSIFTESFKPKETDFGLNWPNLNDKKIKLTGVTYFWINKRQIARVSCFINFDSLVLKFATKFYDEFDGIKNLDDKEFIVGEDPNVRNPGAIEIFNKVAYIAKYKADKENVKHIEFEGATPRLSEIYSIMIKNKSFIENMKKEGWKYDEDLSSEKIKVMSRIEE